jgi:hypothetical protein
VRQLGLSHAISFDPESSHISPNSIAAITMASAKTSFKHSSLGDFYGITPIPNVVQYRCIPFASIPARFKHSELIDYLGEFDATTFGYKLYRRS